MTNTTFSSVIGYTDRTFFDSSRTYNQKDRPIAVSIWYPATSMHNCNLLPEESIWHYKPAYLNAPIQTKKMQLILFSHGFSGSPLCNEWIAWGLANQGYIVASVQHTGNCWGNMSLYHSLRPWNRPQDVNRSVR